MDIVAYNMYLTHACTHTYTHTHMYTYTHTAWIPSPFSSWHGARPDQRPPQSRLSATHGPGRQHGEGGEGKGYVEGQNYRGRG